MKYSLYLVFVISLAACGSIENDLPEMSVKMIDGSTQQMNEAEGKTILVLFQPDCDHCQREATAIQDNLERFNEYEVYFISSASLNDLHQFSVTYKLDDPPNVHFGTTDVVNIVEKFGSIPTPSLYVYSEDGDLTSKFEGETSIEQILQAL